MSNYRLYYIDNLRIFLIGLVVIHHLAITYGGPGDWYYSESEAGVPSIIPLSMFVASNQAFFMGMFFFISAFFIVPSLSRKGSKIFVGERLKRLGIPLILFYFLLSPLTVFLIEKFIEHRSVTFLQYLINGGGRGFGPMWFVEALIIFTAVFLFVRRIKWRIKIKFPSTGKIILSALLIGIGQFIIRIWLPVGWSFAGTSLQFPHFLQYIFLFVFGIVAYQNNWMDVISSRMGWRWFANAQILIFIGFPMLFFFGGATENGIDKFMGGLTMQSLAYTIWEQLVGFSLIIGLFGIFKKHFNKQGQLAKELSTSAFGVYIFHTPILIVISAIFLRFNIPQLFKFIVLAPIVIITCFIFIQVLKQIPGIRKIL